MRVWIFSERHVLASLAQPLDVVAAWSSRNIVIGGAVKHADGLVADVFIADVGREAGSIKWNISGKARSLGSMHACKAVETRVKGCLPAAGEPHQNDLRRVDPRMRGKYPQRTVGIEDHV